MPAYFNDSQRQATKDAGRIAGLDVKRIVNEPTAAALAYGLDKKTNEKIAVYDFGGGTFDVSILEVGDGVVEVLSVNGDTHLGGDNVDELLIEWLTSTFKSESGIDISKDPMAMQRLKEAAEKAKIELSAAQQTDINLPFLTADQTGPKHLNVSLTRSKFEQMIEKIVEQTLAPCRQAMKDSGLSNADINEVLLVGGSTRIPLEQQKVKEFFNKEPNKSVNPDEVVAVGAAVQAGVLAGDVKDVLLIDVTPLSLGIETYGAVATRLIERNTTIPTRKSQVFSTAADSQTSVEVHVIQGEREMARDNKSLGRFSLVDIPLAPRGVPQIEVTFDIDANGILAVSAKDVGTGKEQRITIQAGTRMTDEEIKRMVKDAEIHAEEDKKKRALVEARNQLDSLVFQTEKMLKEHSDKVPADLKTDLDSALSDAKANLDCGDQEKLVKVHGELESRVHKLSEIIYKSAAGASAAGGEAPTGDAAASGTADKSTVVDAEYEDGASH